MPCSGYFDRNDATHNGSAINSIIVADGDSITYNTGEATNVVYSNRYLNQAVALLSSVPDTADVAVGSQTLQTMAANGATTVDPFYVPARKYNITSIQGGINDYNQGTTVAATVWARMQTWINDRLAKGFQVIVFTLEDNSITSNAFRAAFNSLITTNANYVCDGTSCTLIGGGMNYIVADIGASAEMGTNGSHTDPIYFRDGVHPTVTGNALYAQYYKVAINQLDLP